MKDKYSKYPNIYLLEAIYDSHEINWIRSNAALYVHGHSAGGTNPSLVEAMNFGLPIIAFDCIYNRATTKEKCLYWKDSNSLLSLLRNDKLNFTEIGRKVNEIGKKSYSWKTIAEQYNFLY